MICPGGADHTGGAVLIRADSTGDHVANGINHAHPHTGFSIRGDLYGLLRHKFRLTGHNGFAGAALGQFIFCPLFSVWICDSRDHQRFHDPLYQGGFSGTHRPYHTDIHIASGSGGNICINSFHSQPPYSYAEASPCHGLSHGMSGEPIIEPTPRCSGAY